MEEGVLYKNIVGSEDDRSFKEQMNDLGVEVVTRKSTEKQGIKWYQDKKKPPEKLEAEKLLEDKGLKGKISVDVVLKCPKERLEEMVSLKYTIPEMAKKLGIGEGQVAILRKLYDLQDRSRKKNKDSTYNIAEENIISQKTITTTVNAAGGELLGTAKLLERLGDGKKVIVELKVMEVAG